MTLQIARRGVRRPEARVLEEWRSEFAARHVVQIRGLLEPPLLAWIRKELARATFVERVHADLNPPAVDMAITDDRLLAILFALANAQPVFDAVREITGCGPIGCYWNVVYRMDPNPGHHDTWHSDDDGNRMVAMSVNLGDEYEGGLLQIRERGSAGAVHSVANTGPGDAILFRIRAGLEHVVTPVTGTRSKIAMAGWFQRTPEALAALKSALTG